jgi:hypothetical protein
MYSSLINMWTTKYMILHIYDIYNMVKFNITIDYQINASNVV